MKKSLLIVISIVISSILVGCSNVKEPIYYSDNQVKNFVREAYGNGYNFIDKTSYIDQNGVVAYDYKFENNDGHIFSIFSRSKKIMFVVRRVLLKC